MSEDVAKSKKKSTVASLEDRLDELEQLNMKLAAQVKQLQSTQNLDRMVIIVSTDHYDKLMAAFILASSAAAMGMEVGMYFTFWGINGLRKTKLYRGKGFLHRIITMIMPNNASKAKLAKMNYLGLGKTGMKFMMKKHNVTNLVSLIDTARELDVRLISCQMTMDLMGIKKEELIDGIEFAGAGECVNYSSRSTVNYFIS